MARKIYLASSWRNTEQPVMVEFLRAAGHEVYDFRHPHLGPGKRGVGFQWSRVDPAWESWTSEQYRDALEHPEARDGFAADFAGMQWADTCVLLLPCGRSAHAEAGWMAGAGKEVIAALRPSEPELMYGLFSRLVITDEELLAVLADPLPSPEGRTEEQAVVEAALAELQIAVSRPVGVAMSLDETERAQRAYLALDRVLNA